MASTTATVLVIGAYLCVDRTSDSCDGVRGSLVNTTNSIIVSFGICHSDVPILSKVRSPRILDNPEFPAIGSSPPAYSSDSVVCSNKAVG